MYPIWRIIRANQGVTLSDIEYWTLEDVDKFNALIDMDEDHNAAYRAYLTPEPKE